MQLKQDRFQPCSDEGTTGKSGIPAIPASHSCQPFRRCRFPSHDPAAAGEVVLLQHWPEPQDSITFNRCPNTDPQTHDGVAGGQTLASGGSERLGVEVESAVEVPQEFKPIFDMGTHGRLGGMRIVGSHRFHDNTVIRCSGFQVI